jgi:hypothetical protein
MECFFCKKCNYYTETKINFTKHVKSQKHKNIIGIKKGIIETENNYNKQKIFKCNYNNCSKFFLYERSLSRHQKNTHSYIENINSNILENKINKLEKNQINLEKNQLNGIKELSEMILSIKNIDSNILQKQNNFLKTPIYKTMSISKYAKLYLSDVEPLEKLDNTQILEIIKYKNSENKIEILNNYVFTLLLKYEECTLSKFIGDCIVDYYSPKIKNKINVITSDQTRKCFIIMTKIIKNENNNEFIENAWVYDQSALLFVKLILQPLLDAIVNIFIDFIKLNQIHSNSKYDSNEYDDTDFINEQKKILNSSTTTQIIRIKINNGKYNEKILNYVSSYFRIENFSNLL